MSSPDNTLFLRLAGPMQSWGTSSRLQLRRTDSYPSKSGVLGMVLCAMGIRREDSPEELAQLTPLPMGVRVDRRGILDWDYHTAGAKIGIRQAGTGKPKITASTKEVEALLSRREYLYDAAFLVALQGAPDVIGACARAIEDPVWPVFLGRKCCVPAEPVFAGVGSFDNLSGALSLVPWRPRINAIDRDDRRQTRTLETFIEHPPGRPAPAGARLVYDVPRAFGFNNHGPRWVIAGQVTVPVGEATQPRAAAPWRDPYGPEWEESRPLRLKLDNYLCVFCKAPAVEVHHLDYGDVRPETLRSLCKMCHEVCTMLEYGHDMRRQRIDPTDPAQRDRILEQIKRLLTEQVLGRRRELLETVRMAGADFFDDVADSTQEEEA